MTHGQAFILSAFILCGSLACKGSTSPNVVLTASISPPGGGIAKCNTVQLTLSLSDATGASVMADSVHWVSSAPDTASVSASGLVRALADSPGVTISGTGYARSVSAKANVSFSILSIGPLPCS